MQEPANLELTPEQMRALGYRVVDMLVEHFAHLKDLPVGARGRPEVLRARLMTRRLRKRLAMRWSCFPSWNARCFPTT